MTTAEVRDRMVAEVTAALGGPPGPLLLDYIETVAREFDRIAELLDEEEVMAGIELRAPVNPYRAVEGDDSLGRLAGMEAVREPLPYSGPGLLGADIDRIARAHHQKGYREGEADQMKHTQAARSQTADAFDEGFVAGRMHRATGLARDFHVRMMEPLISMVALHTVIVKKGATKKDIAEAFNRHETAMREAEAFAEAMMDDPSKSVVDDPHVERG